MSKDPFAGKTKSNPTPGIVPGGAIGNGTTMELDFSEYRYVVGYYQIGGEAGLADKDALEVLLTRSLKADGSVVIIDRKESISPATGTYTVVITYVERRVNAQIS